MIDGDGRGTRLQALIARAGIASRRAAEELIRDGRVSVNGRVIVELGSKAGPGDDVRVDGKPVVPEREVHYLALNKPPGYLCSMSDERGRPLAVDLFKPRIRERVYSVGRLDLESSGLILFTNDGSFAAKVGHPSSGIIKTYEVSSDRPLGRSFADRFIAGIEDDGETLRAVSVEMTGEKTCVVSLSEGKNREIRRALAAFSAKAVVLRRVKIGALELGDLPEGSWRRLEQSEVNALTQHITERKP